VISVELAGRLRAAGLAWLAPCDRSSSPPRHGPSEVFVVSELYHRRH
jgi:hypothetical protein